MPIGVRGGVVHVQTRAAVTDLMDDLTWREARYFGQRFPRPDMLHEPPLPALHVMAAPTVCYMDIFAKQQWHCPPGSSQVNLRL